MAKQSVVKLSIQQGIRTIRDTHSPVTSVQKKASQAHPIVHADDSRFFLDECKGEFILIDWDELDPPEGSPGAVEISHEASMEAICKRFGFPPGALL